MVVSSLSLCFCCLSLLLVGPVFVVVVFGLCTSRCLLPYTQCRTNICCVNLCASVCLWVCRCVNVIKCFVCVCVCVCVCVRERERERESKRKRLLDALNVHVIAHVEVCFCVCVWDRQTDH